MPAVRSSRPPAAAAAPAASGSAATRQTRQRAAIREAIDASPRPLLPQEVLDAAQQQAPGLGIATVYRNLKALVEEGALKAVNLPGENPRFEPAGRQHHHHFQCLHCQRVFDVQGCPGNLAHLAPAGFQVQDHDLTLYGRCADCAATGAALPAASPALAAARGAGCTHEHHAQHGHDHHGHGHDDHAHGDHDRPDDPATPAPQAGRVPRRSRGC